MEARNSRFVSLDRAPKQNRAIEENLPRFPIFRASRETLLVGYSGFLAHEAELALGLDMLFVQVENALEGGGGCLEVSHHLVHVAEEEVRGEAAIDELQGLLHLGDAVVERALAVAGEQEAGISAPGIELRL